jgi:hypothetical protein
MNTAIEHVADRPSWMCRECGMAWPCVEARADLRRWRQRTVLCVYLAVQLREALRELPDVSAAALYDRFLGWPR